jgi:hypothetical protein
MPTCDEKAMNEGFPFPRDRARRRFMTDEKQQNCVSPAVLLTFERSREVSRQQPSQRVSLR